jgi:hypothetical protein
MRSTLLLSLLVAFAFGGCASRSKEAVQAPPEPEPVARPAHKGPVCLLEKWLPTGTKFEDVEEVSVKKAFYGSVDGILPDLADQARELGANVVHKMRTGQSIGLIAWARPYAYGDGVFVPTITDEQCEKLGGRLF